MARSKHLIRVSYANELPLTDMPRLQNQRLVIDGAIKELSGMMRIAPDA